MNEGPQQTPEAEQNGPLGGERLAAARRAHEISATDIAKELHLDELKIRALERNDFGVLGGNMPSSSVCRSMMCSPIITN
jgi:hypothetical protein